MVCGAGRILRDFPTDTLGHVAPALHALSSLNPFVVCGAGLPIPIIPSTENIAQRCITQYHEQLGCYPVRQPRWSEFRYRLLAPLLARSHRRGMYSDGWKNRLLIGVHEAAFVGLFQRQIHRPFEAVPPSNYRVFDYVPPPAVLFDFNSDGQLPYYCEPPHLVLTPHGVIDRRSLEHPEFEQWLRDAAEYGLPVPTSTWQWLPGPEPTIITRRLEYNAAARRLSLPGDCLILIGYSFGRQRNGAIDDSESFEFLRELLHRFPRRQVVVVDPNPEPVAGLLEDALRQRISACNLYWNYFSEAACLAMEQTPDAPNLHVLATRVARLYDERTR
jgi:hypothetical protein